MATEREVLADQGFVTYASKFSLDQGSITYVLKGNEMRLVGLLAKAKEVSPRAIVEEIFYSGLRQMTTSEVLDKALGYEKKSLLNFLSLGDEP